jgi:RNA polymerase sigma-70 factor (ECF subfamily)
MEPDKAKEREAQIKLLKRIGQGDRGSFEELYDRFSGLLFSPAYRVLNNQVAAEDVLQGVFLQVWEKAPLYNPALGKPLTWAVTLTRNKAMDRRNRLQDDVHRESEIIEQFDGQSSFDAVASVETSKLVREALEKLSKNLRRVSEFAFFSSMTQTEIAERLNEPLGTIKARIRRAMMKLRDVISPRCRRRRDSVHNCVNAALRRDALGKLAFSGDEPERLAATVKDWSHGYLDPIRLAVLAIIQDGLAARAAFVHRAAQPLRRFAIGFLALQNRAELFPAQFFERISTNRAEGGVYPLHQAGRARHYQTIRSNLLRAIAEQSQNSRFESRRRSKVAWTQRGERDGGANFGQFADALPEFIVEFEHQFKLLPFLRQHGARYVEHSSFLKKIVIHWESKYKN